MSRNSLQFDEQQIGNPAVVMVLKQIDAHQVECSERMGSVEKKLDSVISGFSNGDFEGHRRYHDTIIEMLAERRRLRIAIQEKTISGLIWAAIVMLGAAVAHEIHSIFGRPL